MLRRMSGQQAAQLVAWWLFSMRFACFPIRFKVFWTGPGLSKVLLMGSSRRAAVLAVLPEEEKARIGAALPAETATAMGMSGAMAFEPPAREGRVW